MHHPVYSSGSHGNTNWLHAVVVPLLEAGGVDLVLAGHDHHYERSYEITDGEITAGDPLALTYIVAGAGGAGVRPAPGDWWTDAVIDTVHTYLRLDIDGCVATGVAIDENGNEVDEFTLDGCEP